VIRSITHTSEVDVIRFNPDGKTLATVTDSGQVYTWQVDTGRPAWTTVLLAPRPEGRPWLLTHQGWQLVRAGGLGWQAAAEQARLGSMTEAGGLLCLLDWDDKLQLWDSSLDRQVCAHGLVDVEDLIAHPGGCLALSGKTAFFLDRSGRLSRLGKDAEAVAVDGADLLIASGDNILIQKPEGNQRSVAVGRRPTALNRIGGRLVLGFHDGSIETVLAGRTISKKKVFSGTIPSRLERLAAGPEGILVAGYQDGHLGLWDLEKGILLEKARLNGPLRHILVAGQKLYAASDLGDHLVVDLETYLMPYCRLLQEIWQRVPAVWANGRPLLNPPDSSSGCTPQAKRRR